MFEPLKDILNTHGENLTDVLRTIRTGIVAIASNTEAQLVRNQFARKTVEVPAGKTASLRNDSAYGWKLTWVASVTKVRIFIGTETDDAFFIELPQRGAEKIEWYVPVGGVVFIKNQAEAEAGFTNFEVEVMVSDAVEGYTGVSEERIEAERTEPVPSGTPEDTVTIP